MAVEASIVVVFGDDADTSGVVVVELDPLDDRNLDADGEVKSTFNATVSPVDTPALIVHHSETLSISSVLVTSGSISGPFNGSTQEREVDFSFGSLTDEVSIGYANAVLSSSVFYGNEGILVVSGNDLTVTGGTIPCAGIATMDVIFQSKYVLTPPFLSLDADESYPITVFIYVV